MSGLAWNQLLGAFRTFPSAARGLRDRDGGSLHLAAEEVTVDEVFGEGGVRPRLSPDIRQVSRSRPGWPMPPGHRSANSARRCWSGYGGTDAWGRCSCALKAGVRSEDLWFCHRGCIHASTALTNAALYGQKARIAENLQRGLIPISARH